MSTGIPNSTPMTTDSATAIGSACQKLMLAIAMSAFDVSSAVVYAPTAKNATKPRSSSPASPSSRLRPIPMST